MGDDDNKQRTPADEIDKVRPPQPGKSEPRTLSNEDAVEIDDSPESKPRGADRENGSQA